MRNNQRWFVIAILVFCLAAIPVSLIGAGKGRSLPEDDSTDTADNTISAYFGGDYIEVIRLSGLIAGDEENSSLFSGGENAGTALKLLRKAVKNKHVKAVLFRIDSPGGTVSTSQEIADEIKFLQDANKPVVVSMGDLAASGGYYVACNAQKIVADPGTITGSIGVIISSLNLKGLGDKLGLQPQVIKSGQFKDIGSPYRAMTAEDKAILQNLINDAYDQFTLAVSNGRHIPLPTVKKLADGRIYSGRQALQLGLVDKLGGYTVALGLLQDICKERYGQKLFVKEANPKSVISSFLESTIAPIGFRAMHGAAGSTDLAGLSAMVPEFMKAKYYHQPLWLMP